MQQLVAESGCEGRDGQLVDESAEGSVFDLFEGEVAGEFIHRVLVAPAFGVLWWLH